MPNTCHFSVTATPAMMLDIAINQVLDGLSEICFQKPPLIILKLISWHAIFKIIKESTRFSGSIQ